MGIYYQDSNASDEENKRMNKIRAFQLFQQELETNDFRQVRRHLIAIEKHLLKGGGEK